MADSHTSPHRVQRGLGGLRKAARTLREARARYQQELVRARESGWSYEDLAKATEQPTMTVWHHLNGNN